MSDLERFEQMPERAKLRAVAIALAKVLKALRARSAMAWCGRANSQSMQALDRQCEKHLRLISEA
jgi:hypothetical protein